MRVSRLTLRRVFRDRFVVGLFDRSLSDQLCRNSLMTLLALMLYRRHEDNEGSAATCRLRYAYIRKRKLHPASKPICAPSMPVRRSRALNVWLVAHFETSAPRKTTSEVTSATSIFFGEAVTETSYVLHITSCCDNVKYVLTYVYMKVNGTPFNSAKIHVVFVDFWFGSVYGVRRPN